VTLVAILFWLSAALIVYTHAGYPLVLRALLALRRHPVETWPGITEGQRRRGGQEVAVAAEGQSLPSVSLIVPAYDEEEVIAAKVANALALEYPRERLQLIVASDGSTDATAERARAAGADLVLELPPGGKVAALNAAAEQASGELLACSDANSVWAPDALRRLVAPFADPAVGYACGQVRFVDAGGDNLEGAYWRYEMAVREMESALGGITAGNGAIYAVRRSAYLPLAPSGKPRPLLSLRAGQARPALALRPGGAGGGEDGADDGGRVRPQTADDGRALGHRRRRRHAGPARLLAPFCLRARLAPAAALSQPSSPPGRLRHQRRPARPGTGLRRHLRRPAGPARGGPVRPPLAARPVADRPLLRDDDRLDRRRPLGPLAPRRLRRWEKAEGTR